MWDKCLWFDQDLTKNIPLITEASCKFNKTKDCGNISKLELEDSEDNQDNEMLHTVIQILTLLDKHLKEVVCVQSVLWEAKYYT